MEDTESTQDGAETAPQRRTSKDWDIKFPLKPRSFFREFENRQPRMLQILEDLKETADFLDFMKKKAKLSSVVNSSLGVVGGFLSIVGLALISVTYGVSLALTVIGIGLVVANGVNTTITIATEKAVNTTQHKRAKENFKKFSEELQKLQECLKVEEESITSTDVGKSNLLRQIEDVSRTIAKEATVNIKLLDAMGEVPPKDTTALSKPDMSDLVGLNVLLVGMDVSSIYNNSIQLAEGCKSHEAELIREKVNDWYLLLASVEKKLHDLVLVEQGADDVA